MNCNWTYFTPQAQGVWLGQSCLEQLCLREGVRVPVRPVGSSLVSISHFELDQFGLDQFDMNKTIVDHAPGGSSG